MNVLVMLDKSKFIVSKFLGDRLQAIDDQLMFLVG